MTKVEYENYCRQSLLNKPITRVLYGELNYAFDEDRPAEPVRYYHTGYEQLHTLDFSLAFHVSDYLIYITWDGTFYQYGLYPFVLTQAEYEAKREQRWDVSTEIMWSAAIGQRITQLEIIWEDVYNVNLFGGKQHLAVCPLAYRLIFQNGYTVFVCTAELSSVQKDGPEAYGLADNLLVTADAQLAKKLNII